MALACGIGIPATTTTYLAFLSATWGRAPERDHLLFPYKPTHVMPGEWDPALLLAVWHNILYPYLSQRAFSFMHFYTLSVLHHYSCST